MTNSQAEEMALEILAGIPYFPREDGTRAAILRALAKERIEGVALVRAAECGLQKMAEWGGVPRLLESFYGGGDAMTHRQLENSTERALGAIAEPVEPLTDEEKRWIADFDAKIKAKARISVHPTRADYEASKKLLEGI